MNPPELFVSREARPLSPLTEYIAKRRIEPILISGPKEAAEGRRSSEDRKTIARELKISVPETPDYQAKRTLEELQVMLDTLDTKNTYAKKRLALHSVTVPPMQVSSLADYSTLSSLTWAATNWALVAKGYEPKEHKNNEDKMIDNAMKQEYRYMLHTWLVYFNITIEI